MPYLPLRFLSSPSSSFTFLFFPPFAPFFPPLSSSSVLPPVCSSFFAFPCVSATFSTISLKKSSCSSFSTAVFRFAALIFFDCVVRASAAAAETVWTRKNSSAFAVPCISKSVFHLCLNLMRLFHCVPNQRFIQRRVLARLTDSRWRRLRDFPHLIITLDQSLYPRNRKLRLDRNPLGFPRRGLIAVEVKLVLLATFRWICG